MANKFGKFLLCTAAIGTAAAAAYYYLSKKDANFSALQEYDDLDDFSEDFDDDIDTSSRNYVPLNRDEQVTEETETSVFTPLSEQAAQNTAEKTEETVEEFFDEDDAEDSEEEPPIQDME